MASSLGRGWQAFSLSLPADPSPPSVPGSAGLPDEAEKAGAARGRGRGLFPHSVGLYVRRGKREAEGSGGGGVAPPPRLSLFCGSEKEEEEEKELGCSGQEGGL